MDSFKERFFALLTSFVFFCRSAFQASKPWLYKRRYLFYGLFLGIVLSLLLRPRPKLVALQGQVLGTAYQAQYLDRWGRNYQSQIETLLAEIVQTSHVSSPQGELAQFNAHDCSDFSFVSPWLYPLIAKSKIIHRNTRGAFDPTVLPWVVAWRHSAEAPSVQERHSLQAYVGLDYLVANETRGKKLKECIQLDFGGLLQGFATDQVAALLRAQGITHLQVTLGDSTVAYGQPSPHTPWQKHLALPGVLLADTTAQEAILDMVDQAIVYKSQQTHRRLIDPATGSPPRHTLLAAWVVAPDGATAEAYATAMMVRGPDFAQALLAQQTDLAAVLVYQDAQGTTKRYVSPTLQGRMPEVLPPT